MVSTLTLHAREIQALCARYHVRRLEVFGSAAGQGDPGGDDLDFLVEFDTLALGGYSDAYFGLLEALQALLDRPVDLVVASAVSNPYFRESVERSKTLLYAS
jgi:uncharacterized protein